MFSGTVTFDVDLNLALSLASFILSLFACKRAKR